MRKAILPLMHSDTESIMWSYTNLITEKSNKEKKQERKKLLREQKKRAQCNIDNDTIIAEEKKIPEDAICNIYSHVPKLLTEVTEAELVVELARRRASKFALKGSLQKTAEAKNTDEAPFCSINGGPGTVPCYQLME